MLLCSNFIIIVRYEEMKMRLKHILSKYFNSKWIPTVTCLVFLAGFTLSALLFWRQLVILSNVLFVCLAVAFLGILCAAVWNLIKRRWAKGVINIAMFPLCGVAALVAIIFLMFASMLGPSEDGFADNLIVPSNIEITEPQNELMAEPGGAKDSFQQNLLSAIGSPGGYDPIITANVTMLVTLYKTAPEVLMRYLATSPSWRVFKEHDGVFATRRWMVGSKWLYNLHGYYTRHDIDFWSKSVIPYFQSRITIGFSGKPWASAWGDVTKMRVGQTMPLILSKGNQMRESRCIITADDLVVEVFEQSDAKERRLTKAALAHVEKELAPLASQPTWETIRSILPAGSIRQGEASLELRNSFQPGLYDSEIWVNPGEPGMIYLKAFEITQGTPLSVDRLKVRSNEWIGWSGNPEELFFSNTHFTIYEGDWGKPYAARFEVWFTPDSGRADRKLLEEVFKIEGWQR